MLIRSQDGKRVVETSEVWIQRHADRIIEHHYIFAATELDPEGICLGQYDSEEDAKVMLFLILYRAGRDESIDLCMCADEVDKQNGTVVDAAIAALLAAVRRFGVPKKMQVSDTGEAGSEPGNTCPNCHTTMHELEDAQYCPKCGVTA